MDGFHIGYTYFSQNAGAASGAWMGSSYIDNINAAINDLEENINAMKDFQTAADKLKGDVAEFWHSGTFNMDAAVKGSENRTFVDRSHDFASADISSNFDKQYGLKYYGDGAKSAIQQAKSWIERYKEYQTSGGKDSLEKFVTDRGFRLDDLSALHDPIYTNQYRLIPADQLQEAEKYLTQKIAKEQAVRPEQVKRYQDTLNKLCTKIKDADGNESIPLTKQDAEVIARLAKEGGFDPAQWGLTTEKLVSYQYILEQAFKAGTTAAVISLVLKIAPEIYKSISYLIRHGEIDVEQIKKIGFAALSSSAEGFIRGSIAAAITASCKAGLLGQSLKAVSPSVVGTVTVIAMNTVKNAFAVAAGKMERRALTDELIKDMFVSGCALAGGSIMQGLLVELPIVGFMLGSFVGSMVGGIVYSTGYQAVLSFCVDTGFTMFGLVEQDYTLPECVMREIGIDVLDYQKFSYNKFAYVKFEPKRFTYNKVNIPTIDITFLRRGVIGIRQIGYI